MRNTATPPQPTIPLCLWDYETKLKAGDRLLMAAFGGGFTWGGVYMTWAYDGCARSEGAVEQGRERKGIRKALVARLATMVRAPAALFARGRRPTGRFLTSGATRHRP